MFNEKLYPTTFTEKQTTSISATRSHYIGANPLTFTVYVMGTLNWNRLSKTLGNLTGLSRGKPFPVDV